MSASILPEVIDERPMFKRDKLSDSQPTFSTIPKMASGHSEQHRSVFPHWNLHFSSKVGNDGIDEMPDLICELLLKLLFRFINCGEALIIILARSPSSKVRSRRLHKALDL